MISLRSRYVNEHIDNNFPELMNQEQAAAFLGVTAATLRRWAKEGRVPVYRYTDGGKPFYFKSKLLEALQNNGGVA